VTNTIISVQDMWQNKKGAGCFELFGFDIMLDDNFHAWLIEVNESPSMEYSTDITARLVPELLADIIKVVIDWAWTPPRRRHNVDTGMWDRLYWRN